MRAAVVVPGLAVLLTGPACRDLSGFSTVDGSHYEGAVVNADFVLAGVSNTATMCLTLDTDHLQDAPGAITTRDGRFTQTALRPIPQIWHDPLSTLSFGEGRLKNLIYVVTTSTAADGGGPPGGDDVFVIVSLMQSGNVEVRLLRGAPGLAPDGAPTPTPGGNLFAIFELQRREGPCSF